MQHAGFGDSFFSLTFMRSYLPRNTGLCDIKLLQLLRLGTLVAINYGKEQRIQDTAEEAGSKK